MEELVPILKRQGNRVTLLCCFRGKLSLQADHAVVLYLDREACELNLAPTSSSTLMIAFGDALAVVVSSLRGFSRNDFARFHPSGSLGKTLLLTVKEFMHSQNILPFIHLDASFQDLILIITKKKLGVGIVIEKNFFLKGIITDGDLRRFCGKYGRDIFYKKASEIMTISPKVVSSNCLAYESLQIMKSFSITSLVVVEHKKVVGLLHIHDLIKAGIQK